MAQIALVAPCSIIGGGTCPGCPPQSLRLCPLPSSPLLATRCSDVKLGLFRAHCIQLCWVIEQFNITVMKRFEAAYNVKCVNMFCGFARLDNVTVIFCEIGLPTFKNALNFMLMHLLNRLHMQVLVINYLDLFVVILYLPFNCEFSLPSSFLFRFIALRLLVMGHGPEFNK